MFLQARLWVQVLHNLRSGAKLKHVNVAQMPVEYELTPYECLMHDIRSKKYNLNKVMAVYANSYLVSLSFSVYFRDQLYQFTEIYKLMLGTLNIFFICPGDG